MQLSLLHRASWPAHTQDRHTARRPIQFIAYAVCMALSLGIRLRPQQPLLPSLSESAETRICRRTLLQRQRPTPHPPCDAANQGVPPPRPAILASSPGDHNARFTAAIGWGSRSRISEQIAPGTRRACRHRRLRFGLPSSPAMRAAASFACTATTSYRCPGRVLKPALQYSDYLWSRPGWPLFLQQTVGSQRKQWTSGAMSSNASKSVSAFCVTRNGAQALTASGLWSAGGKDQPCRGSWTFRF